MARCARSGSFPASHAITASTANSGSVCSHARIARARPWEIRNCAASAPQATRNAESRMLGKVHSAASAEPPACIRAASSFRSRTGPQLSLVAEVEQAMPRCRVTRRVHFNAAHRLFNPRFSDAENERIFGLCNNPNFHGHNYDLEVSVEGEIDPATGYVMDIQRLKELVADRLVRHLDHKNLNLDVPWFADLNPTAEHIAVICWRVLAPAVEPAALKRIHLWETDRNYVDYHGT